MAEESKIEPISLEQEEQRRKKLKLQLKNIENQYQDIYGDIWGDKDKQWEVTTTIEEDLESALKPFSDSGQYNQKELNTIKTHLSNKLKKERASRGMGAGTSDINYPGGKTSLVRDKIQAKEEVEGIYFGQYNPARDEVLKHLRKTKLKEYDKLYKNPKP